MNAHLQINKALVSRGLLPMDGYCTCLECGATGLDRDQMSSNQCFHGPTCKSCEETLLSGYRDCPACVGAGKPSGTRVDDYVRGQARTEWCERCDGYGRIYVGVPKRLQGGSV